ncbi:MAG: peptidoglycan bridge formation glycyltransferase FemA/FemB family protein [Candidatus Nomurabacteria bacterium]|jgi:lipid II:glycine glycyltransferase (peptidoglycan interpeptide bridge formation enzyme)|nr:peptidoglycan bridge formation glycyltransferase FemA/FemB family protein [Candidatus Nomurabacteria bacterium]
MIREINDQTEWDALVAEQGGHPLQLWAWGELKSQHGPWTPTRLTVEQSGQFIGGAQVLARKMPKPFGRLFYMPRGPFCAENNRGKVLKELGDWAKNSQGVELKIEPDWLAMKHWPTGWRRSKNRILVPQTAIIELSQTEDEILAGAVKKTRQYIRKSENSGVTVRRVTTRKDIAKCLKIYHDTAEQKKFGLHDDSYYYDLSQLAGEANMIYLAEKDGQPLSFLWNLRTKAIEFELYGGVNEAGQELKSNYCLKWHAIKAAKTAGIETYDMNGLLNDGISNFKRSFTGSETNWVGTWDKPLSPLYYVWETALPTAKRTVQALARLRKR